MSANLNKKDGKVSLLNATGKKAWHGMGRVLDEPVTAEEALKEAQLDFKVEGIPMYVPMSLLNKEKLPNGHNAMIVPNHFANIRMDTQEILGVVGNRYKVLQNADAFKFFDSVVGRDEAVYETAGVLGKGEKVWISAKLPAHIGIMGSDDEIEFYTTLFNSHDGSSSIFAMLHTIAIVCENTLNASISQAQSQGKVVRIRHTISAEANLAEASKILGLHNKLTEELSEVFNVFAKTKSTGIVEKALLDTLFPLPLEETDRTPRNVKQREALVRSINEGVGQDLEVRKGTIWGLYNGLTNYLDHQKSYGDGKKLESVWLGNSSRLRQQGFNLCYDYSINGKLTEKVGI